MIERNKGFTIVELLIVIVAIAILAAISVVAYNGMQQRAQNSARISAATSIAKAFDLKTVETGQPYLSSRVCLPIGNQDVNGDGLGDCRDVTDAASVYRSESAAGNAELQAKGLANLKFPTETITDTTGKKFAGIEHGNAASTYGVDGEHNPRFLIFYLARDDQDCGSSYSIDYIGGPSALYAFTKAKNASSSNGVTTCNYTLKFGENL